MMGKKNKGNGKHHRLSKRVALLLLAEQLEGRDADREPGGTRLKHCSGDTQYGGTCAQISLVPFIFGAAATQLLMHLSAI